MNEFGLSKIFLFNLLKFQHRSVENVFFDYTKSKVNNIVENSVENVKKYLKTDIFSR